MLNNLIQKLKRWDKQRRIEKHTRRLGLKNYPNLETLFSDFYDNKTWSGGKGETVSGSGSTLEKTQKLRNKLPRLFKEYDIETIFDAPCGDYNWFRYVERDAEKYIGGDIVQKLVEENRKKYANDNTRFIHFNILEDKAPQADVWFCRDTLLHFSYDNIHRFLQNFVQSDIPYLLVSTYHECNENIDIPTGAGRPLNLEIPPFNLPPALDYLDDWDEGDRPKKMGLWSRGQLMNLVRSE